MASYYPPSIATAINSQESTWGVQYTYIPSTTTGTNTKLTGRVLNSRTRTNGAFDPSGSPPRTLPKVNFDSSVYYGSGEGTSVTATPTIPAGSGFYAWAATFVSPNNTSTYYLIAAGSSAPAQKWSVSSSGKLSATTFSGGGYQVWIAVARKYKVTCEQNYGTVEPTILYGQTTLPTLTREGYRFDGWYSESTGGTKIGDGGSTYTPTADITIYAHWTQIFTISFNANGGTGAPPSVSVAEGGQWTCPSTIPTKSNSNFAGWAESQSATPQEVAYYPGASYPAPSANLVLYAVWVAEVGVIVYNPMGGTMQETVKTVEVGSAYGELPIPTLSGWTFTGWFTAATGGSQVTSATVMQSAGNVVIYARWAGPPMTSYVFFDANGGTAAEHALDPRTVTEGSAIGALPTVVRANWTFARWKNAATGAEITASTVMGTSDIYAVAEWTRSSHTITFDPNGGTLPQDTETVYDGEAFGSLPIPQNDGSNFVGWFTEGGDRVPPSSVPGDDAELRARWEDGTVEWFRATKAVAGAGSL
jgi:uncharacterized repeat protein (TIGR02543 family)